MPDIFGKNPEDYTVVREYQAAGMWERRQQALAGRTPHAAPIHDFDAMGKLPAQFERQDNNAQVTGYITNSLQAIQTMVDETLYLKYRLPEFIPMNMSIPDGASSYLVRIMDRSGRGQFITKIGTDAPTAQVSQRTDSQTLHLGGIDALWTLDDARESMMSGVPLDTKTIEAAVEGAMDHMEAVGISGSNDLSGNPRGLINYATSTASPVVTDAVNLVTQAASMTFDDLTGMQIYHLIVDDISWVVETSRETFGTNITEGMCIYLPTRQYNRLASRFIGDNQERSVMRAVREDNPWTERTGSQVMFRSVSELNNAGVGATVDRMITAVRDDRVFEMGVSIMPRVIEVMSKGRWICAPVEYKFSPLFWKRPTVVRYRDAV